MYSSILNRKLQNILQHYYYEPFTANMRKRSRCKKLLSNRYTRMPVMTQAYIGYVSKDLVLIHSITKRQHNKMVHKILTCYKTDGESARYTAWRPKPSCRQDSRPYCLPTCNFLPGGGVGTPRNPYFGRTGVRRGSAMVPFDRALVGSYRLSIVTMSMSAGNSGRGHWVSTPVWYPPVWVV